MSLRLFAPWFGAAVCACSVTMTLGRKVNTVHVSDIRRCVTTERMLLTWFGEPYKQGNENGLPTLEWQYMRMQVGAGGGRERESQSLVVVLNQTGRVVYFALNPTGFAREPKDVCATANAGAVDDAKIDPDAVEAGALAP